MSFFGPMLCELGLFRRKSRAKRSILFTSFIELILTEEQNKLYKCGVGQYKIEPPEFGNEIPINYSSPLYKRRLQNLDSDGFKKFNIYLDFENLKEEMKIYNLEKYQDTIISCMEKAANTLMSLLRVKPSLNDYWISDSQLTRNSITYWEKEKKESWIIN